MSTIHPNWSTSTLPRMMAPGELAGFGERLAHVPPNAERVLRARCAGMSIPEIEAAFYITAHSVKNATYNALHILGIGESRHARVARACYLLGCWDREHCT